jgi:hypothetical protein
VTFVVVRYGAGAALLYGQPRLRAIVANNHYGLLGRVEIEADDVRDLLGEVGIIGGLEGASEMRLEPMLVSDAQHADPRGHGAHAPVRGLGGDLKLDGGVERLPSGRLGSGP